MNTSAPDQWLFYKTLLCKKNTFFSLLDAHNNLSMDCIFTLPSQNTGIKNNSVLLFNNASNAMRVELNKNCGKFHIITCVCVENESKSKLCYSSIGWCWSNQNIDYFQFTEICWMQKNEKETKGIHSRNGCHW